MLHNLLSQKRKLCLVICCMLSSLIVTAQTRITGKITGSDDKQPVIGASVKIKGTSIGTVTGPDGTFAINAQTGNVLVISYIGYETQELVLNNETNYNIIISPAENTLNEVVVTGYSSQRKKDLTGSVAVVNIEDLKAQPAASAVEALQGKAAGVQIVNDGAPGSTPQIRIRGYSTINNNEPLYVVDGVPYEGKLNWLNQNDIESMQILKDASSASIYGARANNGVVIITTKKGQQGPPEISFDAYYGSQSPRKEVFPDMLNPQQYAEYLFTSYTNAGKNPAEFLSTNYGGGTSPVLPEYLVAGGQSGQQVTAADADQSKYNYSRDPNTFYQITRANQAGTNWFDVITDNAPVQNYQLGATGGGESANYAFSGSYLDQDGTIQHTGFKRYTARANTSFRTLNSKFRFGENFQYSYTEGVGFGVSPNTAGSYQGEGSAIGWAYRIPTIIPVYDEGGNFAGSRGSQLGNAQNPLAFLFRQKDNLNKNNLVFGNLFGEVDVINGLTARTSFGLRYENYNGITAGYPNLEFSEGSNNNNLFEFNGFNTDWTWTNTLNYTNTFAEDHRLTLLAGTEAIKNRNRQLEATRNNYFILGNFDYYYLDVGTTNISNRSFGSVSTLFSLFGRADYGFKDKYLLSATIRRDGSSNFGSANKYGYFPAFSLAWRLSEEEFMKQATWINDFKIRGGYGETGNQRIPGFQFLNRFQSSLVNSSYPISGGNNVSSGVRQNAFQNTDIKWEALQSLNLGADFTLFDNVLDGSFDWYDRKTKDLLYRIPLPTTGIGLADAPFVNVGDISNKGVELVLNYHYGRNSGENGFKFDVGANISRNINKLTSLAPGVPQQPIGNFRSLTTTILKPGEPFGSFFGFTVDGIYQNATEVTSLPGYTGARVGGLKFKDLNGDDAITPADRGIIGDPNPDFIYGVSLNFSYRNWDLGTFFNGSQGNDLYEATRYFTDFPTFDGARSTRLLNAWSPSNTSSNIPSPYNGVSDQEYQSSSYYIQDGSFFRMKNLQIGYSIPENVFSKKLSVKRLRVYVSGTNLFTVTNYTGLDPEISQSTQGAFSLPGVDQGIYPAPRQFLLGINASF